MIDFVYNHRGVIFLFSSIIALIGLTTDIIGFSLASLALTIFCWSILYIRAVRNKIH
jgi:hypothetical protein